MPHRCGNRPTALHLDTDFAVVFHISSDPTTVRRLSPRKLETTMARTDAIVSRRRDCRHLRSRCISPNAGSRWRWSTAAGRARRPRIGNAGIIEGNTIFPPAFPNDIARLLRIALKRAPEANYHLAFLPRLVPWLLAYRANSRAAAAGARSRA